MISADTELHRTPAGRTWTWVRASLTKRRNLLATVHVAGGHDITLCIPAHQAMQPNVDEQIGLLVDAQRPPPPPTAI